MLGIMAFCNIRKVNETLSVTIKSQHMENTMKRLTAVALVLLAMAIVLPTTFTAIAADQSTANEQAVTTKININSADLKELQKVPGIGPATASKIVTYRDENGPFSQIDQLTNIKGIGKVTLEKMKPYITM